MSIQTQAHSPSPSARIQLFTVDATAIGGDVFRFTPSRHRASGGAALVSFGGVTYQPVPVEVRGFEWSGRNRNPRPRIKVPSFVNAAATAAGIYGNLLGAKITRQVTLRDFLDDGADPDATAVLRLDVFWITRRVTQNRLEIEWELRNATDLSDRKVPFRQVLPNTCTHTYRVPDGEGGFTLTNVTCPWGVSDDDGGDYYDLNNDPTTAGNDACPKTLAGCTTRYGRNSLPLRAYPGVGNIRR